MTAKELIEYLQKFSPDAKVYLHTWVKSHSYFYSLCNAVNEEHQLKHRAVVLCTHGMAITANQVYLNEVKQ